MWEAAARSWAIILKIQEMLVQFGKFKLDKAFELNDNVGQIKVGEESIREA